MPEHVVRDEVNRGTVGLAGLMQDQPQPEQPASVGLLLGLLEKQQCHLHQLALELEDRLGAVLVPAEAGQDEAKDVAPNAGSAVSCALDAAVSRTVTTQLQIQRILARIDL